MNTEFYILRTLEISNKCQFKNFINHLPHTKEKQKWENKIMSIPSYPHLMPQALDRVWILKNKNGLPTSTLMRGSFVIEYSTRCNLISISVKKNAFLFFVATYFA